MIKLTAASATKLTAIIGAAGVGLGAFGAHGLQDLLMEHGRMGTWETAVFYHIAHAIVLLVLAVKQPWKSATWLFMTSGILIFSGSLYILCLTNITWLGAITPIGGVLMIVGWLRLFFD